MGGVGGGGSLHNEVPCRGVESLYGEVQYIMGNGNMGRPMDRMMDRHN